MISTLLQHVSNTFIGKPLMAKTTSTHFAASSVGSGLGLGLGGYSSHHSLHRLTEQSPVIGRILDMLGPTVSSYGRGGGGGGGGGDSSLISLAVFAALELIPPPYITPPKSKTKRCVTRVPYFEGEEERDEGEGEESGKRRRGGGRVRYHDLYESREEGRHKSRQKERHGGSRGSRGDRRQRSNQEEEEDDDKNDEDEDEEVYDNDADQDDDNDDEEVEDNNDDDVSTNSHHSTTPTSSLALAPVPLLAYGRFESMLVTPRIQQSLLREAQSLALSLSLASSSGSSNSQGGESCVRLQARVFVNSTLGLETKGASSTTPSSLAAATSSAAAKVPLSKAPATTAATTTPTTTTTPPPTGLIKSIKQLQMMLLKHMLQPATLKHTTSQETQVYHPPRVI